MIDQLEIGARSTFANSSSTLNPASVETNRNERAGSKSSRETRGRRGCIPGVENDSKGKRERRREREREK